MRDEFRGFHAVGGEFGAIAILFEHAADEFANADGVVGDDDEALLIDAVDSFGGNCAARDGSGTRGKNARGAGVGLDGRRSFGSLATMRFKSMSRMRLPSGAMVVPGKSLTRRRYSPRFLMTISSLPRTSSTTRPICRLPAFATTMRK